MTIFDAVSAANLLLDRHPNHRTVRDVMACYTCTNALYAHIARIRKQAAVKGRPC